MPYLLLCLPGDDATNQAYRSAATFEAKRPAEHTITDVSPAHEDVRREATGRDSLVVCHNGSGSLRAVISGEPWCTANQFADMFQGCRVYVYACDTLGQKGLESLSSFGHSAVQQGVRRFAGHCCSVPVGNLSSGIDAVLHAMWDAFLSGSNDTQSIQKAGQRAFLHVRMHKPAGSPGFLQLASQLSKTINSLRVVGREETAALLVPLAAGVAPADPVGAVGAVLALPDGHLRLDAVDEHPARLEGLAAVRSARHAHDREVAHHE